jgi:TolB protein
MRNLFCSAAALLLAACGSTTGAARTLNETADPLVPTNSVEIRAGRPVASLPGERFFRNVRQLTFDGENAEAYWSADGTKLVFQRRSGSKIPCDQIFVIDLTTGEQRMVSSGKGRTTCAYFLQDDAGIVYASTHLADPDCPPPVMVVDRKYVWPIYKGYDIFRANVDGTGLVRLTDAPGYDAEATVCPVSGRIVFTSVRDGDLELYSMEPDGTDVKRLTNRIGYDGGAFFSHDGRKLVQRSGYPANADEEREYLAYLQRGVVVPSKMEITVLDRDGSNFRKVTENGKANFAPFWHPDNRRILFASNMDDARGRNFEIYMIDETGENQVRITQNPTFDGFPMFSPNGRHLVFASNRYAAAATDTNVFVAEWVESGDAPTPEVMPEGAVPEPTPGAAR